MAKKNPVSDADVSTKLTELREKVRAIRFSLVGSRPKNVREERGLKKEIARLETKQRELSSK